MEVELDRKVKEMDRSEFENDVRDQTKLREVNKKLLNDSASNVKIAHMLIE